MTEKSDQYTSSGYSATLRHAERKMRCQLKTKGQRFKYDECRIYVEAMCKLFSFPPLVEALWICGIDAGPLFSGLTYLCSMLQCHNDMGRIYPIIARWTECADFYESAFIERGFADLIPLFQSVEQLLPPRQSLDDGVGGAQYLPIGDPAIVKRGSPIAVVGTEDDFSGPSPAFFQTYESVFVPQTEFFGEQFEVIQSYC